MMIYLIRHTDAVDRLPDHARTLSDKGREQARTMGKFLRGSDRFTPDEIWHSELVRAKETAELLVEHTQFAGPLRQVPGLRPNDDPAAIAQRVAGLSRSIALVGHEPFLSALGSLLVTGSTLPSIVVMKKGAVLALEGGQSYWAVRWHVYPGMIA